MAEIKEAGLRNIIAGMMERQAESAKAAPTGVVGSLWEKATGEISRYNEAVEKNVEISTKQRRTIMEMEKAQKRIDRLNREVEEGLHNEADAAKKVAKEIGKLTDEVEKLSESNEDLAESLNESTQRLEEMNKGGGILRNGLTVLAAKAAGAATAFFGFRQAIAAVDERLGMASKTVGDFGALSISTTLDKTASYTETLFEVAGAAMDWHSAISDSSRELMKFGIGTEESKKLLASYADGLRLTTLDQGKLIDQTQKMAEDTGFLATLLRVNTDELATATVDASKRFGKPTASMADDLSNLYYSFQGIKESSRGTVINFGDLTRATLEAQSSFQGYNFNLKATANILGNVVAKAQEQGATYDMAMKSAKGLAGVLTGGKAPDWAKFVAGRKLRNELIGIVREAKKSGADIGDAIRKTFGKDLTDNQVKNLKNVAENWKTLGPLSSSKMTEELLRGTDKGMEAMFKMMKKHADKPEGRELLMRVWGIDEAAATATLLTLQTTDKVSEFAKLRDEAKAATNLRKPPTVNDLKEQTRGFAEAIGKAQKGISGAVTDMLDWMKQNPVLSAATGMAGTAATIGISALQSGVGEAVGRFLYDSSIGKKVFGGLSEGPAAAGGMAGAFKGMVGGAASTASMGTRLAFEEMGSAMGTITKSARGFGKAVNTMGSKMGMLGKGGMVGLALGVGAAVGSLLRLIPGVDRFTEGLINSAAGLMGFKHSLDEAETSQAALNNKSPGVVKAVQQMTVGATTAFDKKGSLERQIAVRQLRDASTADIDAYAEQISKRSNLTVDQARDRLMTLSKEKAMGHEDFMALRGGGAVTKMPTLDLTSLGAPAALPKRGRRAGRGRQPGRQQGPAQNGPDGSIAITVTIPRDAIAKSDAQAAGMSE